MVSRSITWGVNQKSLKIEPKSMWESTFWEVEVDHKNPLGIHLKMQYNKYSVSQQILMSNWTKLVWTPCKALLKSLDYSLKKPQKYHKTISHTFKSHAFLFQSRIFSSGTDEVRVCEWALLVKSVSKLYFQVDLICQNRQLVSYRRVPGSIPGRGRIDYFSLFFDSVPFLIHSKFQNSKCAAFQLWTPTYFWVGKLFNEVRKKMQFSIFRTSRQ